MTEIIIGAYLVLCVIPIVGLCYELTRDFTSKKNSPSFANEVNKNDWRRK